MQDVALGDKNEWVAGLFQQVLGFIQELEFTRQSPSIFLVYAHESGTGPTADAKVAQQVIRWLNDLGAHLYSDRSPGGNYHLEPRETEFNPARAHDILSSQLCLLPKGSLGSANTVDTVDSVILCGSELLGEYLESDYYRDTYSLGIQSAYNTMQAGDNESLSILSNYVNTQVTSTRAGFHHVLTELAFLELRIKAEPTRHNVVPFLLKGRYDRSFPKWVRDSTVIRIEDGVYREPGHWNGQPTYQDEGLHLAFFKLLKRLWPEEAAAIQTIEEEVYQRGLQSLQQGQSSVYQSGLSMKRVIERFTKDDMIRWRAGSLEKLLHRVDEILKGALEQRERSAKLEIKKQLNVWYPSVADASVTGRLAIQRISGETLPMEYCYINLGVVEYQSKQNQDMKNKASNRLFYRLRSAEAVTNTHTSNPIALADLFTPRRLKSGVTDIPKRILIRGRAGIGKTTLAKKSMYDHIHNQHWTEHFNYVLWIRLRHLKGKPTNYSLKTLLYEEYFEGYSNKGHELAELLYEQLQKDPQKTLFMLDGWDEIIQEPSIDCLHTLVNHPRVIITSRPHGVSSKTFSNLDLELETIGFSQANVMAYLNHREIVDDPDAATAIKTFIQQHPFVKELVNIPIQLDALCYSWELIQDRPQPVETMTGLYQVMTEQLWRKDIVRLRKQEQGSVITKEQAQSMLRFESLVEQEKAYLEVLAVNGLYHNQIEFNQAHLTAIAQQFKEERDQPLPFGFEESLAQVSCLQCETGKRSNRLQSCQFLHLTFQEFFAAQSIAKTLTERQPLTLLKAPAITADAFIRQYKYDPRYEIVWWLIAGLLEKETLIQFFGLLDEDPQDLIGIQHQYLLMHCLRESHGKLPLNQQKSLRCDLSAWLDVEIMTMLSGEGTYHLSNPFLPDSLLTISHLGSQDAFPEELLMGWLTKECVTVKVKQLILNTLQKRHRCSHSTIQALIRLLEDTDSAVRQAAAKALEQQSPLAPAGVETLICLLQDPEPGVRQAATETLGRQSPLAPAGVEALIRLLQDPNPIVTQSAVWALRQQSPLATAGVKALIRLLQDPEPGVRQAAAQALGQQSALAPAGVEALIRLLQDPEPWVRNEVAWALEEQSPLAPADVEALIRLLQDSNPWVRKHAAWTLGKQSPLASAGIEALIRLLQDAAPRVREVAAEALGKQPALATAGVEALIRLLQDPEPGVREVAAEALGKQSALAPAGVEALIRLLQNPEPGVRQAAAWALEKQSALATAGVEALIRLLQDPGPGVRKVVARVLGQQSALAPARVEALIRLLQDSDPRVRRVAAEALGQQSALAPAGAEALIPLLQDSDSTVREAAAWALGQQSALAPAGVEALIRLLQDSDPRVRRVAAEALGQQSWLAPAGVESFIPLLQDSDSTVREAAAKALGQQSALAPAGVEALIRLLQDSDSTVRQSAVWVLGQQSPLAPAAVKPLIRLLQDDPELVVREAATRALERQSPLAPAGIEALIRLLQDTELGVRAKAAEALEKQSPLAPAGVESLIHLLQNPDPEVRKRITLILNDQDSWNIYRLLPTMNPSLLTAVYSHWMISYNFKQPAPLYLQSGVLHFYTPEGLETVALNQQEVPFKQAIVDAQQAIGIPKASQIRLQGFARRQGRESYSPCFAMPGSWPVASQYEASIRLSNCTKTP